MSSLRQAAQAALLALLSIHPADRDAEQQDTIAALRAALAQPEPKSEPEPGPKPKLFTLSDRLRPGVECAAWVIDDVRRLESAHAHQYAMAGQMLREAERAGRERDEAVAALRELDPLLDGLICYASGTHEYEPNRIIAEVRAVLAKIDEGGNDGTEQA